MSIAVCYMGVRVCNDEKCVTQYVWNIIRQEPTRSDDWRLTTDVACRVKNVYGRVTRVTSESFPPWPLSKVGSHFGKPPMNSVIEQPRIQHKKKGVNCLKHRIMILGIHVCDTCKYLEIKIMSIFCIVC